MSMACKLYTWRSVVRVHVSQSLFYMLLNIKVYTVFFLYIKVYILQQQQKIEMIHTQKQTR